MIGDIRYALRGIKYWLRDFWIIPVAGVGLLFFLFCLAAGIHSYFYQQKHLPEWEGWKAELESYWYGEEGKHDR